jgi:hypothetical protein
MNVKLAAATHESVWQTDSMQQLVRSALGWEMPIPMHWSVVRDARTIRAAPPDAGHGHATPPFEFGTHPAPRGRAGTLGGACEDRLTAGGARIVRRQVITASQPTILLDAVADCTDDRPMRASLIAEMIDDGALCVYHICRDWSSDQNAARSHALRIWRAAARTPHPIGQGRRRWIHEAARLHLHFPTAWLIDEDTPTLLVARHRRRVRSQPSLILTVEVGTEHARSLTDLRARLGANTRRWVPARIGNRGGLRADEISIDQHDEHHLVRQILPEPTSTAAVWAQISVDAHEQRTLDLQQNAFTWNES